MSWEKCECVLSQIPHLVELGINAVELLPVLEYDELEFQRSPNPRDHMVNIWGYSHISFIAPISSTTVVRLDARSAITTDGAIRNAAARGPPVSDAGSRGGCVAVSAASTARTSRPRNRLSA